jgi:5-methylcytosine-specific restriction endonuclease McrA
MQTWIFQGNPDEYDIDGYLISRPAEVVWLVNRYASEIAIGDRVYLWRNQGKQNAVAGVVAEGIVIAPPYVRAEAPDSLPYWRISTARGTAPQIRAGLRLVKVASKREVLRRAWCLEDPILKELPNLKMQAGTNYKIAGPQAQRLDALWTRTGRDWTRNEALAGLWAYDQTYGGPVSSLPGAPVSRVALAIGRAVSGVYAKVMNFRSLDPRAAGEGMSGAGEADKVVWKDFFDVAGSTLRTDQLNQEFVRIWGSEVGQPVLSAEVGATAAVVAFESEHLETLDLSQLLAKYTVQRNAGVARPSTRVLSARAYERDPLVIAIGRKRANHRCEVKDCEHPSFETPQGLRYTEVHHIIPLAEGGDDTIENVACLCAAHHREVHLGAKAGYLTLQLKALRSTDATSPPPNRDRFAASDQ